MALASRFMDSVNLPVPLTPLIGREREIAAVIDLLRRTDVRLVTLTGPGGVGKTRLAIAVATQLLSDRGDGGAFISLGAIRDPALVLPTIAQGIGIRGESAELLPARVAAALRNRRFLLVLDNFEQVLDAAADVADLLATCPTLTVLVTSRASLGVSGERHFPVPPLALPGGGRPLTPEEIADTEAVALFVAHAVAVDPSFTLTVENAPSVVAICVRLDGLPLAIELAAKRVDVLPPPALLARLTDRLSLLTGGAREQPLRLRSMRHAISWSHDLLSPTEQALFRRFAVFSGGCSLEAVEAVCGEPGSDALDGITALLRQSLLRRVGAPGGSPRFEMLETVREYACERLIEGGEEPALCAHHAAYFAEQSVRFVATWWITAEAPQDQPNVRAALDWAMANEEFELAIPLAIGLWQYFEPATAYDRLEAVVQATPHVSDSLHGQWVQLLTSTAMFALMRGDVSRASELADRSAVLVRESASEGDPFVAGALLGLGAISSGLGEPARAEAFAADALRRWQALGHSGWTGYALSMLGIAASDQGQHERADELLAMALKLAETNDPEAAVVELLSDVADAAFHRGDYYGATKRVNESLTRMPDLSDHFTILKDFEIAAAVAAAVGWVERAARLFGAAEVLRERTGVGFYPADAARCERMVAPVRARLSETAIATAWETGRSQPLAESVAEAVALVELLEAPATSRKRARGDGLTPRELEVLRLVAEGRTDPEIAVTLFITHRTARAHVASILAKLNLPTRSAAATHAVRHHLV